MDSTDRCLDLLRRLSQAHDQADTLSSSDLAGDIGNTLHVTSVVLFASSELEPTDLRYRSLLHWTSRTLSPNDQSDHTGNKLLTILSQSHSARLDVNSRSSGRDTTRFFVFVGVIGSACTGHSFAQCPNRPQRKHASAISAIPTSAACSNGRRTYVHPRSEASSVQAL